MALVGSKSSLGDILFPHSDSVVSEFQVQLSKDTSISYLIKQLVYIRNWNLSSTVILFKAL